MDTNIPDNVTFFIKCISNTHHIDLTYLKQLYVNCSQNRLTIDDLSKKGLDELNKMCELRGIPKIGTKDVLIEKIISNTNPETELFTKKMSILKDMCKQHNLKMTGNKTELVLRLYYNQKINTNDHSTQNNSTQNVTNFIQDICNVNDSNFLKNLSKDKLIQMCKDKHINHVGSKKTLIDRIVNHS